MFAPLYAKVVPGVAASGPVQDVRCGVSRVIGVGIKPAVDDPRRHCEQCGIVIVSTPAPGSGCQVLEMGQHRIVNMSSPSA